MKKLFLIVLFLLSINAVSAIGGFGVITAWADVILQWDANTEPDLSGYKLYYKKGSTVGAPYDGTGAIYNNETVDSPIDVGLVTEAVLKLPDGVYHFAVTAYDTEGLESDYSNDVGAFLYVITLHVVNGVTVEQ